MPPPEPISAELLLEHNAFLKALARSLVLDESRADDVVQETYMAALRRPPPSPVRLRAWLAAVLKNLARRSYRTEGRLRRREQAGARQPDVPGVADVAARLEVQRDIADAVARLAEPGRTAIVLRYFDGLKPAEIAAREGVSVRTIESRLRRARGRLRGMLDARHGGGRRGWTLAIAPSLGIPLDLIGNIGAGVAGAKAAGAASGSAKLAGPTALGATVTGVSLMSTKIVVALAAACMAGAFFAGWELAPATSGTAPASPAAGAAPGPGAGPQLGAEGTRLAALRRRLETVQDERRALEAEVDGLRTRLTAHEAGAAGAGGGPAPATTEATSRPRYTWKTLAEALDEADWAVAGEAVGKLVPHLADLTTSIAEGQGLPDDVGDVQRWNAPLVALAVKLKDKVPGTGINGSFTHPAVMVNLIHATLARSEVPLDDAQAERLGRIGDAYVAEDERRLAAYGDDVIALQKALDETALKDRFFAEVDAMLAPAQRDVLHPPELVGRVGVDLFSSGLVWQQVTKAIVFFDRSELGGALVKEMMTWDGLGAEERPVLEAAARDWARGFADDYLAATDDPVTHQSRAEVYGGMLAGWMKVEHAAVAARHQVALHKALLERLPADSVAATRLRTSPRLAAPVKQRGK
jgi:RNA polymerase sigma-70 factor (ECF subfamily)